MSWNTSQIGNEYGFQGRRFDAESGLMYFRHRMFSPEMKRFVSMDPAGFVDSYNLYETFACDPVNYVDPWGLENEFACVILQKPSKQNPNVQWQALAEIKVFDDIEKEYVKIWRQIKTPDVDKGNWEIWYETRDINNVAEKEFDFYIGRSWIEPFYYTDQSRKICINKESYLEGIALGKPYVAVFDLEPFGLDLHDLPLATDKQYYNMRREEIAHYIRNLANERPQDALLLLMILKVWGGVDYDELNDVYNMASNGEKGKLFFYITKELGLEIIEGFCPEFVEKYITHIDDAMIEKLLKKLKLKSLSNGFEKVDARNVKNFINGIFDSLSTRETRTKYSKCSEELFKELRKRLTDRVQDKPKEVIVLGVKELLMLAIETNKSSEAEE